MPLSNINRAPSKAVKNIAQFGVDAARVNNTFTFFSFPIDEIWEYKYIDVFTKVTGTFGTVRPGLAFNLFSLAGEKLIPASIPTVPISPAAATANGQFLFNHRFNTDWQQTLDAPATPEDSVLPFRYFTSYALAYDSDPNYYFTTTNTTVNTVSRSLILTEGSALDIVGFTSDFQNFVGKDWLFDVTLVGSN